MAKRRRNKIVALMHYVWVTHDRLPLLTPDVERAIYRYIEKVCREDGCSVLAIGGLPDHVHLLVNMSPTVSMADLMKHVKGGSARLMKTQLKPDAWFAWQPQYGVFNVTIRDKRKILEYIAQQKQRHAEGTLLPELEETYEEYDTDSIDGPEST